ncbi:MAG TPA: thiamine pyrophosphate-binding protein [Thermoanaerobaculia bacterium]|nr:thiamine pyrophosphate-binding protein [Thermoanaerobaculia bacterium]
MRGKQVLLDTLLAHDVEHVFGNPGTTESPLLDALLDEPRLRYVLALHEGVALGAAHHYAQAAGRVGFVNLHVAPGLGNALGMLYNAWEACSPLVITAGQADSRLLLREPLLAHDLVRMAEPLVKWSAQAERGDDLALLLHRAFQTALEPPRGPVFVALPMDVLEQETENAALPRSTVFREARPDPAGIEAAARVLAAAKAPVIVAGDGVTEGRANVDLLAVAELLGARLYHPGLHHHLAFPMAHPAARQRMPFDAEGIRRELGDADAVLLVGGSFFEEIWYSPGSYFPTGARVVQVEAVASRLARNFAVDVGIAAPLGATLHLLASAIAAAGGEELRAAAAARRVALHDEHAREVERQRQRAAERHDRSPIAVTRLMRELAKALPDDAVVVNEAITASPDLLRAFGFERAHDYYGTRGGGIGQALPGALGVKLAHPQRPVVAVSGDGSAMYSIQALWTAAHHELAVLFVILHNREYRVLKHNMDIYRKRFGVDPTRPYPHMDLDQPHLDFPALARSQGVDAAEVRDPAELPAALERAFGALATGRPYLLDVWIEGMG